MGRGRLSLLFETHFDSYVRAYEERFEPRSGPLRPVVARSVEEFLSCGRLQGALLESADIGFRKKRKSFSPFTSLFFISLLIGMCFT